MNCVRVCAISPPLNGTEHTLPGHIALELKHCRINGQHVEQRREEPSAGGEGVGVSGTAGQQRERMHVSDEHRTLFLFVNSIQIFHSSLPQLSSSRVNSFTFWVASCSLVALSEYCFSLNALFNAIRSIDAHIFSLLSLSRARATALTAPRALVFARSPSLCRL